MLTRLACLSKRGIIDNAKLLSGWQKYINRYPYKSKKVVSDQEALKMSQARVAELVERATSPDLKAADMEAIKQIITMVNDSEQK